MNKSLLYITILCFGLVTFFVSCSSNSRSSIPKIGSFGEQVDLNSTFFNPGDTQNLGQTLFTGEIVNYCKGEGCWLSLKNENGKPILVEIKDKQFVLPLDINGSNAFIKGELQYLQAEKYDFKIIASGITIK
ncbi:MAG: DUF4920 domain-containing protein [Bacteroidia bacterium]